MKEFVDLSAAFLLGSVFLLLAVCALVVTIAVVIGAWRQFTRRRSIVGSRPMTAAEIRDKVNRRAKR